MDHWVLNASPVICLARVGHLELLLRQADETIIPQAVATEIMAGPEEDVARQILSLGMFRIVDVHPEPEILAWDLGRGETAVLSYAMTHPGWAVIIDDRAARKCARSFDLPCKGTLAIVLQAKKRGLIVSAADVLRSLIAAGLRLDDEVVRVALEQIAGEHWPPPGS